MFHYLSRLVPHTAEHTATALALSVLAWAFPAPAMVYQGLLLLIVMDTLTGIAVAVKTKRFRSRQLRQKLLPKMLSYALVPGALYTFSGFLEGTPLFALTQLMAQFTLASVAFIELTSIMENASVLTGSRLALRWSHKDVRDLLEEADDGEPLPDGKPRTRQ